MADDNEEPKLWVTVIKLVLSALVLIILVGLGLYYTAEFNTYEPPASPPDTSWGIAKDHPVRNQR
jgi:hypothetical protein